MGLQSKQENTFTFVNTVSDSTIILGTTLLDTSKAEVDWTVRAAQSITGAENYSVTVEIISTTQIRIRRGASFGTLVVEFEVIERTAADPFICDRGTATLTSNPLNIAIPNRSQGNRYSRVSARSSTAGRDIEHVLMTHEVSSNTNLLITGNNIDANTTVVWQVGHDTSQTVYTHSGLATGTSTNVNISADNIVLDETYTLQSMRNSGPVSPGIDADEIKGANITSISNLNLYSYFADDHFFTTQLVHRPQNFVQRVDSSTSVSPFTVVVGIAYLLAETYVNLAVPGLYFVPSSIVATPNNSQDFAYTATIFNTTDHVIQKYIGGVTSRVISEIIEYDKNPPVITTKSEYFYRMNNVKRMGR